LNKTQNNSLYKVLIYINVTIYLVFVSIVAVGLLSDKPSSGFNGSAGMYILYTILAVVIVFVCYGLLTNRKYGIPWAININFVIAFLIIGLKTIGYLILIDNVNEFYYLEYFNKETFVFLLTGGCLIFLSIYYKILLNRDAL